MLVIKFNPPRLPNTVYPRKRLYRQIQQTLNCGSALWVQGPIGSGKTTLVASFLHSEHRQAIWYQMDDTDGEASTFFRQMSLSLKEIGVGGMLPVFDPRLGQDPVRFAREFFQAYFAQLPAGMVLVLDDYHEVESSRVLDDILLVAMKELPDDRYLIVISRSVIPETLARPLAEGRLHFLGWEMLRLDDKEARHITHLRLPRKLRNDVPIEEFNRRTQGWVAGLVLIVQQILTGYLPSGSEPALTPETFNEYFGSGLFGQRENAALNTLMTLSYFSHFTLTMAEAITGDPKVPDLVEKLYRRGFFLTRHQPRPDVITYRLHPLFLEFLRHEAARRLSPEIQHDLSLRAAGILANAGQIDEAFRLYQSTEAWSQAEALLLAEAPQQYQRGEFDLLRNRLARLPESRIHDNAWLSLWRGASTTVVAVLKGREDLKHAYTLFRTQRDDTGALLAWCIVVEGYILEWGNLHPLDEWISAFAELEPILPQVPVALAQRATFAMFAALSYRRPYKDLVEPWAQRTEEIFVTSTDPYFRAFLTSLLAFYYAFSRGQLGRAMVFINEIKAQQETAPGNPLGDIVFLVHYSVIYTWHTGDAATGLDAVRRGIEIADTSDVHMLDFFLHSVGVWSSLLAGEYELTERYLNELGRAFNHQALLNRCVYHDSMAILNLHRGNIDLARAQSDMSLELARRGGMPYAESACLLTASRVRSLTNDWDGAAHYRQLAADIAQSMDNLFIQYHLYWFEAADALQCEGDTAAIEPLRSALEVGRSGNFFANLWLDRKMLARLCHLALRHEIEPDYVQRFIASLDLTALDPTWGYDNWPFHLRIEVLSGLHVTMLTRNGYQPVNLHGRSAQLLETLVWLGGQAIGQDQLADILWPDAEGDAARRNFDTTLHRLRRALSDEQLLLLEGGRLSLNAGLVWTDIRALEMARDDLIHAVQAGEQATRIELAQETLIENIAPLPTSAPDGLETITSALQRKLEQALDRAGSYWQEQERWDNAVSAYEARLRLNPAGETSYLQLMRIYTAQRLPAEAMAVYQRGKSSIENSLGIAPGPEIEAEYQRLLSSDSNT